MDISSLNSFLHVTSKSLNSLSRRHHFNRLPEAIISWIIQYFLPVPQERNQPFNRLACIRIFQSKQASYPFMRAILYPGVALETEIAWKNKMDDACRREQQRQSNSLLVLYLADPIQAINDPLFPSNAFSKQPGITYIRRCLYSQMKPNHQKDISIANDFITSIQGLRLMPNCLNSNFQRKGVPFSLFAGGVAIGGVIYSMLKAVRYFKMPFTFVICAILFLDLESKRVTWDSITLVTSMEMFLFTVGMIALARFKIEREPVFSLNLINMPHESYQIKEQLNQTKMQLKEIWDLASTSVRERVGLAELLLLAKSTRTMEN